MKQEAAKTNRQTSDELCPQDQLDRELDVVGELIIWWVSPAHKNHYLKKDNDLLNRIILSPGKVDNDQVHQQQLRSPLKSQECDVWRSGASIF